VLLIFLNFDLGAKLCSLNNYFCLRVQLTEWLAAAMWVKFGSFLAFLFGPLTFLFCTALPRLGVCVTTVLVSDMPRLSFEGLALIVDLGLEPVLVYFLSLGLDTSLWQLNSV